MAWNPTPACVTLNGWPPIVRFPVRDAIDPLGPTEKLIEALPVPEAAEVMESQDESEDAVQAQPAGAFTLKPPEPPLEV